MDGGGEKAESEALGAVLMNGVGGRESPGMGVSGSKPLVNGELREVGGVGDDGSETDVLTLHSTVDGSSSATLEDVAVKQSSSVSLIVSGGSTKTQASSTSKPKSSVYSRPQQHRLPPVNYYRYVLPTNHQPIYYPAQPYLGAGLMQGGGVASQLSSTNLYIRGLSEKCCDEDLIKMCQQYGKIVSTKAIMDKETNCCKGYGFVDFECPADAMRAVQCLQTAGVMAQFAKQQEQDPTNLYFSNLPKSFDEKDLDILVTPYGNIVSTRILRDQNNLSRGVGFVRLDSKENCDKTIEVLNGSTLPDSSEPLMVKFADSSSNKKRQQTAGRWRDIGEYMYDATHMLAQNGLVGSRVMQQGMLTSPYVQTPAHHMSPYQVPVSQALSAGAWQPTYYVQPSSQTALATTSGVEGVASHLNHLHISTSSPYTPPSHHQPTGYTPQAGSTSYQIAPHAATASQYPPPHQTHSGWNYHHTHVVPQQDHVPEVHSVAGEGKGHIQVIAADHTPSLGKDDQHSIHLYYPNSWVGK